MRKQNKSVFVYVSVSECESVGWCCCYSRKRCFQRIQRSWIHFHLANITLQPLSYIQFYPSLIARLNLNFNPLFFYSRILIVPFFLILVLKCLEFTIFISF